MFPLPFLFRSQVANLFVIHQLVDKIIRQQKAEREAAENARAETETSLITRPPQTTNGDAQARTRRFPYTRLPPPPNGTATTAAPQRNAEQEAADKARPETRTSLASNPPERGSHDTRARTSTTQTFILTPSIGIERAAPPQQNAEPARAEARASPVSESPQMTTREIPTRQSNIPARQTETPMATLRRQMAERGVAGQARTETIGSSISNAPEMTRQDTQTTVSTTRPIIQTAQPVPIPQPIIPPPPTGPTTRTPRPPATPRSTSRKRTPKRSRLSSAIHKLGRLLGRNRTSRHAFASESEEELSPLDPVPPRRDDVPLPPPPNANLPGGAPWLSTPGLPRPSRRSPPSGPTPASQSNLCTSLEDDISGFHLILLCTLANNIDMAIKACGHERNNLLRNREAMQVVDESVDNGYCDTTGRIGDSDLEFVGMCSLCIGFLIT